MMNINHYNPIKSINVEAPMTNVEYGSGTYRELVEKVLDGTIDALVNNAGEIVGINYNSGKVGAEDSIAQMVFSRRYSGKDVMNAVLTAFEMKVARTSIAEIEEDGSYARIVDTDGNVHTIGHKYEEPSYNNYDEDLPDEVEIPLEDLEDETATLSHVRNYLKREYEHCLARGVQPDIYVEDDIAYVSGIEWGRPLSESEIEALW
jgi:hypothetical protein